MAGFSALLSATMFQILGYLTPHHRICSALYCYDCQSPACGKTIQCIPGEKHCMELNMNWRNDKNVYVQSCTPYGNFCLLETKLSELSGATGVKCRLCSKDYCNQGSSSAPPPPAMLLMMAAAALAANCLRR